MTATTTWQATCKLPTTYGQFDLHVFGEGTSGPEQVLAAVRPAQAGTTRTPIVRLHSACATGDLLGSLKCDCGPQLTTSLRMIGESDFGVLLYLLQHEGRGIGLANKLRAYQLIDQGLDTVQANAAVGAPADNRDYTAAAAALQWLGIARVRLATNNPAKIEALTSRGIAVERHALNGFVTAENTAYLQQKDQLLGHLGAHGGPSII